jgi:cytidyltransferase-like protein
MDITKVAVSGSFDDLDSSDIRFLEEAARMGQVHVFLWSDDLAYDLEGHSPKFPLEERFYLLQAIRYVHQVQRVHHLVNQDTLPPMAENHSTTWALREADDNQKKHVFCASNGLHWKVIEDGDLRDFPPEPPILASGHPDHKRVVVTGCYDWLHSGHVRFFEEVSELGDLYVVVGSDQNVRLLKGDGHPLFPQEERRYMVQSVRYVTQASISSGSGWMDAEPEIAIIKPALYAVNEDGDKPEKRRFCEEHGIQYVVLKRRPREGLPRRLSTALRGF